MAVANKVRMINFLYKILTEERKNLVSYQYDHKPVFPQQELQAPFLSSTPQKEGITNLQVKAFFETVKTSDGINLHGVKVIKNGKSIVDMTYNPYEKAIWNTTHSLSKTVVALAVGMAIQEGYFSVHDSVYEIIKGKSNFFTGNMIRRLTVQHLLTMTSGVNFREAGIIATNNWSDAFLSAEFLFPPGTAFQYNSMNTYMLAKILFMTTGKTLMEYLTPRLFAPLGLTNIAWEKGPEGFEKAGWGMYMPLDAMAKLGQFVLQRGSWLIGGKMVQLVAKEWMDDMLYPHEQETGHREAYGYQIWIEPNQRYYCFSGLFGQTIYINPKHHLVVAVTAGNNDIFSNEQFIQLIEQKFCTEEKKMTQQTDLSDEALAAYLAEQKYCHYPQLSFLLENQPTTFFEKVQQFFSSKKQVQEKRIDEYVPSTILNTVYTFDNNCIGILPVIIQMMNDNFAQGLERVSFYQNANQLFLSWQEAGIKLDIPLGLYEPQKMKININNELFLIATSVDFATDEDDNFVIKASICFLETSSERTLKFFFMNKTNTLKIECDECPSVSYLTSTVLSQFGNSDLQNFLGKDSGYLNFLITRLANPQIMGKEQQE